MSDHARRPDRRRTDRASVTDLRRDLPQAVDAAPESAHVPPASIKLLPHPQACAKTWTISLQLQLVFPDGSTKLVVADSWSSSDPTVAAVDPSGQVSCLANGQTTVTASYQGLTVSTTVTVKDVLTSVVVLPVWPVMLFPGASHAFKAIAKWGDGTEKDVTALATWTWTSTFKFDGIGPAGASFTGAMIGTGTIGATYCGISSSLNPTVGSCSIVKITITQPGSTTFAVGATFAVAAEALFSCATTAPITASVVWEPTPAGVIALSGGKATALAPGAASLVAKLGVLASVAVPVEVTSATPVALTLSPAAPPPLPVGNALVFSASALFSDGTTHDATAAVALSAAPAGLLAVGGGKLVGKSPGAVTVTGDYLGVKSLPVAVEVLPAALKSIAIAIPQKQALELGASLALSASGTWTDGVSKDVTSTASWSASPAGVVSLSGSLAQAIGAGTAMVTATQAGVASAPLLLRAFPVGAICSP